LLSLIPGTISLDVSHDKQTLYIHAIFVTNPDVFRQTVKQEFEQRVAAVLAEDKARHV
jgi:multicomponent Na+:H+ antiporter subunit E